MFKYVVLAALLAVAFADPEPKAKPGILATAPVVAAPLAYSAAYTAPLAYSAYSPYAAYSAPYVASPYAYSAGYASPYAYSAYAAAPIVKYF
ncbi:PREDICTED: pupal cuticle protein C1B-like [Nicrophorus vespilloides]|uniref:Pupal cuticle protein C1B-like n=1 Tax=Nicrophorus vespilloides TaxID=110193 RepID=A0ABM1MR46_NICVS|nr:PREDICTED: pupal cuticle protein C1B-like [Nicrophorus vespilloides]